MKVLHIYKDLHPFSTGGIEYFIHNLSSGLATRGIQSNAVGTHDKPFTEAFCPPSRLMLYPRTLTLASCPISLKLFLRFPQIAQEYDILHYHFPWPFADFLHLAHRNKKPFVITYHSDIIKQKLLKYAYLPLMKKFFTAAHAIIATSENLQYSSPALQDFQHKTISIPFGLDPDQNPTPSPELIHSWRKRVGENFFLFVGVLRYYKGLPYLLEAARNLSVKIVIAGAGPCDAALKQRIQQENLTNVLMVGAISDADKIALIHLARACISSAHLRSEAFSISLLEGLVYGKPLISTELDTGTSFINTHLVSGIVVPPASPEHLKQAMLKMSSDQVFYDAILPKARDHYLQHFTRKKMLDAYQNVYRELLSS